MAYVWQDNEWKKGVVEKESDLERITKFHKHLDICSQCRNHPFDLCKDGVILLKYTAIGDKHGMV
jgi:hypothetical protein